MELPQYLYLIGVLLTIDVIAMILVGFALKSAKKDRTQSTLPRRWSTRRIVKLVLGSAVCVLLLATLAYPLMRYYYLQRVANEPWRPVMAIGGHFSIEVPGRPEVSTTRQPSAFGFVEQHIVTLSRENALSFSATSTDVLSSEIANSDSMVFLKKCRDEMVHDNQFTLKHSCDVRQNGLVGIEFSCAQKVNGSMRFRCFYAKNRLYTLWVGPITADEKSAEAQHFFNSFKIE